MRNTIHTLLLLFPLLGAARLAAAAPDDAGRERFRGIYKELVETNTTLSSGDCTLAAQRMAGRLKAAGYGEHEMHVFVPEGHPREGGLVAQLAGSDPAAPAILMLAHIDVVEARREDWTRDPFTLIEEDGYFYGRGTVDMKAQAAIWVDNLMRFRAEGYHPKRTIKLALTCGEESNTTAVDGAGWLAEHDRPAVTAELAITEGTDGSLDASGKRVALDVLAAEKTYADYTFEVTRPGGHSSRPIADNAIYHLVRAVDRVSRYEFPIELIAANRAYFSAMAPIVGGEEGAAMTAIVRDPRDAAATAILDRNPDWHAMLRTTCTATLLSAGHAVNALPQRARANINCRIMPGTSRDAIRDKLVELAADPSVSVTRFGNDPPEPPVEPLTERVLAPIREVAGRLWPGVPIVPVLEPGGSDAQYLDAIGTPTYGVTGLFTDPDGGRMHGLNERVRVQSVYEARDFLYQLVKRYAE